MANNLSGQCTANWTFDDTEITVQFTDLSTSSAGPIVSWSWDFDDGTTSNQQNPLHTFPEPDKYDVVLTITTAQGCTDELEIRIEICEFSFNVFQGPCNGNDQVPLTITVFDIYNSADTMSVLVDGTPVPGGPFPISDTEPVTVTYNVPGNGQTHEIEAFSLDVGTCHESITVTVEDCGGGGGGCFLSGLNAELAGGGTQTVQVGTGGNVIFSPASVNIEIGDVVSFQWVDGGHSTTSDATSGPDSWNSFVLPNGSVYEVNITNPDVHPYYCIPHGGPNGAGMSGTIVATCPPGNFTANITFNTTQSSPGGYNVYLDNALQPGSPHPYIGTGPQSTTLSLPGDGMVHEIKVEDNDDPTCFLTQGINALDCGAQPTCSISVAAVENGPYNGNNQVPVGVTVTAILPSNQGFNIKVDGVTVPGGPFSYNGSGPTTVTVLVPGNGQSHVILAQDAQTPTCSGSTSITTTNCTIPCSLTNLTASTGSSTTHTVLMDDNFFAPQNLTITSGDLVEWQWAGAIPHTSTSDATSGPMSWNSGLLGQGAGFEIMLTEAGFHPYYCIPHGLPARTLADGTVSQVKIVPFYDRSVLINETLGTLREALTLEILLTILVVLLMLWHLRSALLVSASLPVAVLGCFIAMRHFGVDANIVALSGIAIVIGTMVDMGIVITEAVVARAALFPAGEKRHSYADWQAIVFEGVRSVSPAVVTAFATTVVSFLPVFTLEAAEGKLFRPLAFTKTFALIAAMVVAMATLPALMHLAFSTRLRPGVWGRPGPVFFREKFGRHAGSLLLALAVAWLLARLWMPLGTGQSVFVNFLFVALIVGSLLAFFHGVIYFYEKILRLLLRAKWLFLLAVCGIVASGFFIWKNTGEAFIPDLDEGSFLLMPSAMPHAGMEENAHNLRLLDMAVTAIPEVEMVVGKAGRAETALDPAPTNLYENLIFYKPEYRTDPMGRTHRQWRDHIHSPDDIWREIAAAAQLPDVTTPPKLQPIETRMLMLQTGMRTSMGVKIFGPDLTTIEAFGLALEGHFAAGAGRGPCHRFCGAQHRQALPPARHRPPGHQPLRAGHRGRAAAHRGGHWRHGGHHHRGGARAFYRPGALPTGAARRPRSAAEHLVADGFGRANPPRQLGENRVRTGAAGRQIGGWLPHGARAFRENGRLRRGGGGGKRPAFFTRKNTKWRAATAARRELPLFRQLRTAGAGGQTAGRGGAAVAGHHFSHPILPVPLRDGLADGVFRRVRGLCRGFWMIGLYGQPGFLAFDFFGKNMAETFQAGTVDLSVAVWVGFLALFGIATNDGVLVATFLQQSFRKNSPRSVPEIRDAVVGAGLCRIRPALMTTATTILALLPVLTATGRGSDIMLPMAIPCFGGMLLQVLTVFTVPVLFCWWKEGKVQAQSSISNSN